MLCGGGGGLMERGQKQLHCDEVYQINFYKKDPGAQDSPKTLFLGARSARPASSNTPRVDVANN